MIRRMGKGDLDAVAAIWLDANREAHDFIPAAYWLGHFAEVRTALARAEVWVFETEARAEISGFIGLLGDYIAGIFVRREARSGGVGSAAVGPREDQPRAAAPAGLPEKPPGGSFLPAGGVPCPGEGRGSRDWGSGTSYGVAMGRPAELIRDTQGEWT